MALIFIMKTTYFSEHGFNLDNLKILNNKTSAIAELIPALSLQLIFQEKLNQWIINKVSKNYT